QEDARRGGRAPQRPPRERAPRNGRRRGHGPRAPPARAQDALHLQRAHPAPAALLGDAGAGLPAIPTMSLRERLTRGRLLALFLTFLFAFAVLPELVVRLMGAWGPGMGEALATFRSFAPLLAALAVQGPILNQPVMEPFGLTIRPERSVLLAWSAPLLARVIGGLFAVLVW